MLRYASVAPAAASFGLFFSLCFSRWRREAVRVLLGGMRVALRPIWRADAPFQETHGRQAVPVLRVLPLLLPLGPPGPAHEATPELVAAGSAKSLPVRLPSHYHPVCTTIYLREYRIRFSPQSPGGRVWNNIDPPVILSYILKNDLTPHLHYRICFLV